MELTGLELAQLRILGAVGISMLLGALIGIDREFADKPAGLRTHMLVAGAATLFMDLSDVIVSHFYSQFDHGILTANPVRIMQAVITGVSFLGAGTILRRSSKQIEGLTTAASILFATAIGIAVALSQLVLAIGATLIVLVVLRVFGRLETWMIKRQEKIQASLEDDPA
jgi:putative Mg2+ transporter-C (MgtC) family protein